MLPKPESGRATNSFGARTKIPIIGDANGSAARLSTQISFGVGLDAPGDAAKQELLVRRFRFLAKQNSPEMGSSGRRHSNCRRAAADTAEVFDFCKNSLSNGKALTRAVFIQFSDSRALLVLDFLHWSKHALIQNFPCCRGLHFQSIGSE